MAKEKKKGADAKKAKKVSFNDPHARKPLGEEMPCMLSISLTISSGRKGGQAGQ